MIVNVMPLSSVQLWVGGQSSTNHVYRVVAVFLDVVVNIEGLSLSLQGTYLHNLPASPRGIYYSFPQKDLQTLLLTFTYKTKYGNQDNIPIICTKLSRIKS